MKIINFNNRKTKLLTTEQQELCENVKISCICKERLKNKYLKDKRCRKV